MRSVMDGGGGAGMVWFDDGDSEAFWIMDCTQRRLPALVWFLILQKFLFCF